jgi:hypothetical protein
MIVQCNMNIFYLNHDPILCAEQHVDKHVVKMTIEYAQLLSTAHHVLDGSNVVQHIYKSTHANHPCGKWVRQSSENYLWLYRLFVSVSNEYTYRYSKIHATWTKMSGTLASPPHNIQHGDFTLPPCCMPAHCIDSTSVIKSYQTYYVIEKKHIHTWKGRPIPEFINE